MCSVYAVGLKTLSCAVFLPYMKVVRYYYTLITRLRPSIRNTHALEMWWSACMHAIRPVSRNCLSPNNFTLPDVLLRNNQSSCDRLFRNRSSSLGIDSMNSNLSYTSCLHRSTAPSSEIGVMLYNVHIFLK